MSILGCLVGVPSNFTVLLTVAVVAGSIVLAGAGVAGGWECHGWSCGFSFLLHPADKRSKHSDSMQLDIQFVLFMSCSLLRISEFTQTQTLFFSTAPRAIGNLHRGRPSTSYHGSFAHPRANTPLFF